MLDQKRIVQLDWLRAIAVLLVLGRHMPLPQDSFSGWIGTLLRLWRQVGWVGVDLFFVLSGFLVSSLLFREYQKTGQIAIGRFFLRRGLKIYPAFYALLLATLLVEPLLRGRSVRLKGLIVEAGFGQNYFWGLWPHTWSLAVEEHFYLLAGLALAGLAYWAAVRRMPKPAAFQLIVPAVALLALASLAARLWTACRWPYGDFTHLFPTHLRLDALSFGLLLSYLHHFHHDQLNRYVLTHRRWLLPASGLLVLSCLIWPCQHLFMHTLGLTLLYLGFGGLLLVCLHRQRQPSSSSSPVLRILTLIGVNSYSIYLWHIAVRNWGLWTTHSLLGWRFSAGWELAGYFFASVVVGVVMAKLIEMPVLAWRDHWLPSSLSTPAQTLALTAQPHRAAA